MYKHTRYRPIDLSDLLSCHHSLSPHDQPRSPLASIKTHPLPPSSTLGSNSNLVPRPTVQGVSHQRSFPRFPGSFLAWLSILLPGLRFRKAGPELDIHLSPHFTIHRDFSLPLQLFSFILREQEPTCTLCGTLLAPDSPDVASKSLKSHQRGFSDILGGLGACDNRTLPHIRSANDSFKLGLIRLSNLVLQTRPRPRPHPNLYLPTLLQTDPGSRGSATTLQLPNAH